jgi:endonuclease/exonuclease/phosphatase family metal-dependent hydrolase
LPLVVRSWNVFHGRTWPESRSTHLEDMVRLVSDGADVVALQEVPLWALRRLDDWSGMTARWACTMPALYGPIGHAAAAFDPIRFRSQTTGQANALLVGKELRLTGQRMRILNPDLGTRDRLLRWRQRRTCHAVDIDDGGRGIVVGNLHTDGDPTQVARAVALVADAGACILCGDFNIPAYALAGFSVPLEGIDQILVRGLELAEPPVRWDDERRRVGRRLLSDHAPIEAVVA